MDRGGRPEGGDCGVTLVANDPLAGGESYWLNCYGAWREYRFCSTRSLLRTLEVLLLTEENADEPQSTSCLLYTSPSPRD